VDGLQSLTVRRIPREIVTEQLIVIGASTPTILRVVDDLNRIGGRPIRILGALDNAYNELEEEFYGMKILGGFEAIKRFSLDDVVLINTIASSVASRVETTRYFLSLGYRFTNIVHPGVNMKYVEMGTGNLIYENALVHPFVKIGSHCVISSNAGIAHESSIGDYCFVGPASYICGKVQIEDEVFIGTGAKVLPRLRVGRRAQIGACALVNEPVEAGQRVLGIPGRAS
jgi:sugar O-acyltransferase (sialic acid O-acetyltransferase NeuD family)